MDSKALYKISYGLYILSARDEEKDNGCIINTVTQVTSTPNRIAVTVNKTDFTHDMIIKTGIFNVSVLTENSKFETFKHWGFQSGRDVDKMEEVEFSRSENGCVYITSETNSFISGKVVQTIDLGTHSMFIADVTDGQVFNNDPSVTYEFYQEHIKQKPQPTSKKGWICTVCGYILEEEVLPADFICPWCKHPASDFKPIE